MPNRDDEPLPPAPEVIEEISTEFIVPDEPVAPVHTDDPFVAASRALVDESARTGEIAPRAAVPVARAAPREPTRPAVEPPKAPAAPVTPEPGARRQGFPLVAALVFLLVGAGGGFFAGMLWERQSRGANAVTALPSPPEALPADAPEQEPPRAAAKAAPKGAKATRTAPKSRTAAKTLAGKGRLDLTAPDNAEVYLDGRRIGRGSMHVDIAPGAHRIEVRLGKARVSERFEVAPNESWTYDVTPTK